MAAMFDLTELTGVHADRSRTAVVGLWQVPATWTWPGLWGLVAGLCITLPLVPLLGPNVLAATFLGAPIMIALTVSEDEAPWRKAAHKVHSNDKTFMFCGRPLDMEPNTFYQDTPSAQPADPTRKG